MKQPFYYFFFTITNKTRTIGFKGDLDVTFKEPWDEVQITNRIAGFLMAKLLY
jgi:hypothetical protein